MKLFAAVSLFSVLLLFPLSGSGLSIETAQKLDRANQSYLEKQYPKAVQEYQEFIQDAENEKPDPADKKMIQSAKDSIREIELITLFAPIQPILKEALAASASDPEKARNLYLQIRDFLSSKKIQEVLYFDPVSQGILEQYLLQKKKDSLTNFSASFLEQVKADKKRKKTIVFLDFTKDKTIEFDVETLVTQNLTNVIESGRSFNISSKNFRGTQESQLSQAKEAAIDFAAVGSYRKDGPNAILLSFAIIDTFKGQRLIEVSVKAPLDFEFFDSIEKIASDLDKNLRNYSRFEDFASITYKKEEGKKLVKEVEKTEASAVAQNIALYVDNQISQTESAFLAKILSDPEKLGLLSAYHKASQEIERFNQTDFPKKVSAQDLILKNRSAIAQAFLKERELYPVLVDLGFQKQFQLFDDYYSNYDEAKEILAEGQEDFPGIAVILKEDLENPLDKDKAEVDSEVAQIGFKDIRRYGLKLSYGLTHSTIRSYGNLAEDVSLEKESNFSAGLVFEQNLFPDFWFYAGMGVGRKWFTLAPSPFQQNYLYLDFGLRTQVWERLSLIYGLHAEIHSSDYSTSINEGIVVAMGMKNGPPFLQAGLAYDFTMPWVDFLDLSFSLTYLHSLGTMNYEIRVVDMGISENLETEQKRIEFSLTAFYTAKTYNFPEQPQNTDFYVSLLYGRHEFKLTNQDLDLNGEAPGVGIGVQFRDGFYLGLDTFSFSASKDDEGTRGYVRGLIQKLNFEVDVISFWKLSLFFNGGVGYAYFYEKSYERYEYDPALAYNRWFNHDSEINSFNLFIQPLGGGIKVDLADFMRLKIYIQPPALQIQDLEYFNLGARLEFKI